MDSAEDVSAKRKRCKPKAPFRLRPAPLVCIFFNKNPGFSENVGSKKCLLTHFQGDSTSFLESSPAVENPKKMSIRRLDAFKEEFIATPKGALSGRGRAFAPPKKTRLGLWRGRGRWICQHTRGQASGNRGSVSYTHLRAHETLR